MKAEEKVLRKPSYKLPLLYTAAYVINYVLMGLNRYGYLLPMPISLHVEVCYVALIAFGFSHASKWGTNASRTAGGLLGIYVVWIIYSTLEALNFSSEIGFGDIITRWLAEYRTMTLQVVWVFMINALIFYHPQQLTRFYKLWAWMTLIAVGWAVRQQYFGFDRTEWIWLLAEGMRTHFVNGIIRYFSFFTDAANYGSCMAASACVFGALFLSTTSSKKDKWLFGITALAALYGMMASGSRSAIFVFASGIFCYCILSKRVSTLFTTAILGGAFIAFLMFTEIGNGNAMIRRMRSAFNKDDNSLAVREINKAAMKRYIDEKPFGLGAGIRPNDVPPTNKNHYLATVAPDSTWVYVDIHYGHLGKFLFVFTFGGMIVLCGSTILFKIKDREISGQMAAITTGAFAMLIAGYANQVMLQFPNCWLFFGNLSLVALAQEMEAVKNRELASANRELYEQELQASQSIYPLERFKNQTL